ncbi:uncharacterized protein LTR77_010408 [Saxophila tyrrhenica]|uniref:FAD-binding domain-containing protein n=1 Tax=Saxophila tyrrhenica TaxID=1690608 RepID=A0AAV9NVA8_9PEZI|nr:hypothetical protein LTR77_010408 [Saxophila tyrrhenica]
MSKPKNILIAGAGVAGPALALLLTRAGHNCTIVERAPAFRASGQQIDISGEALKVIKVMGVDEAMWASRVEDKGMKFVTEKDEVIAAFPVGNEGSLVKELEIMRADLVKVIYERTEGVEYVLDEYISKLEQDGEGVTVSFANSTKQRRFDVVVAADGLRSRTRDLAFDKANTELISKGMYASYLSIPWQESDDMWSRWFNAEGGLNCSIRPDAKRNTSSAYLCHISPSASETAKGDLEEQRQKIITLFKDVGWEAQRVLKEVEKPGSDFYGQEIALAKSASLSNGRVALLGDAGYCPSPLSGEGTSLALVGAYILAGCLVTYDDVEEALRQYEKQVRPFAERSQDLPPGVPWIVNPQTKLGIRVLNNVVWVAGFAVKAGLVTALGKIGGLLPSFGSKAPNLPDFPALNKVAS